MADCAPSPRVARLVLGMLQAIIAALTSGRNPAFTTSDPTVVYLPPGTYIVSQTVGRACTN